MTRDASNLKVGVFICRCGGNISDLIDIDKIKNSLDVEVVEDFVNLCSLNGRKIIRDAIITKNLDRVVIAACSPISHEKTFQDRHDHGGMLGKKEDQQHPVCGLFIWLPGIG